LWANPDVLYVRRDLSGCAATLFNVHRVTVAAAAVDADRNLLRTSVVEMIMGRSSCIATCRNTPVSLCNCAWCAGLGCDQSSRQTSCHLLYA